MLSWDEFDKEDGADISGAKPAASVIDMSLEKLDKDGSAAAHAARAAPLVSACACPPAWPALCQQGLGSVHTL